MKINTALNILATCTMMWFTECFGDTPKPLDLTIIHLNDHHSHLASEPLELKAGGKPVIVEAGGMTRVATQIKTLRSKYKNSLTLHAGDAMSGTLYFTLFKGQADVELLNEIGLDAFTLGNHEFDEGDEVLAKFIEKADFPVIASNVEATKGSVLYGKWKPYLIKEIEGQKVGIIGLETAQKTSASSRPSSNITFYDEFFRVKKYVDKLQSKGIDKIILLSHFGYENDQELAKKIDGIDVIIDGDSHSLLGNFEKIGLNSVGEYPTQLLSKSGDRVCIAQAWEYSKVVGELHVTFDQNGHLKECSGTPHLIIGDRFYAKDSQNKIIDIDKYNKEGLLAVFHRTGNVSILDEDPVIAKKLSIYTEQIKSKAATVIGTIGEDLRHIRVPGKSYEGVDGASLPYGSELAPVIAAAFYQASLRADACIQNAGGVRSGLKAGQITIQDVYSLLPFSNTLIEIEMSGAQIKQLLEEALINFYDNYGSDGSFPYAYGLRYDIDMSRAKNDRVSNLEIKERKNGKWLPLENSKHYIIVVNSYIADGKDGYTTLLEVQQKGGKGTDTYLDYAMSFANYVQTLQSDGKKVLRLPHEERCIKSYKVPDNK
ncbi:MAG: NAD nucleotidase [Campylobacterales bacterium]|nr:NAD nucleotidase [Campylobacterales bacterium]